MTPTDQALLEEIEKRHERCTQLIYGTCLRQPGTGDFDNAHEDRETLLRLLKEAMAQQRTPGFIEACPGCGTPRFYGNGDKGSDGGCDGGWYDPVESGLHPCPLRTGAQNNG